MNSKDNITCLFYFQSRYWKDDNLGCVETTKLSESDDHDYDEEEEEDIDDDYEVEDNDENQDVGGDV